MDDLFNHQKLEITIAGDTLYGGLLTKENFQHRDLFTDEVIEQILNAIMEKFGQ